MCIISWTILICLEKDIASELSWKVLITGRVLSIIQLIVVWILYNSAMNFVKSKSCKKNPPKIFGLFQRNIFTFLQTLIFFTFQSIYQLIQKLLIFSLSDKMESMKNVQLILWFSFYTICSHTVTSNSDDQPSWENSRSFQWIRESWSS